jgi:guanylate kinase
VGKGTVVRRVLELVPDLLLSVSCTTRHPRPGEVDGRDYRFVQDTEFDELVSRDAFLEWAEIFGNRYGTLADDVEKARAAGRDVLLEIDVQGARTVRSRVPDSVSIFIEPPSEEELARRLRSRRTESGEALERRLEEARREMAEAQRFDHIVVNDAVDEAAARVVAIIEQAQTAPRD